jgi:hypothetical protein
MSPELLENGGIRITLRAHVVCGHCTECADYNREDTREPGMFGPEAQAHFEEAGWSFLAGHKQGALPDLRQHEKEGEAKMKLIYFNLHKRGWSIKNPQTGLVENKQDLKTFVLLKGVTFKVNERARQRVIAEKRKNVHAFACGEIAGFEPSLEFLDAVTPVTYNPYKAGHFVRKDEGHEGEAVHQCRLLIMGTKEIDGKRVPQLFAAL